MRVGHESWVAGKHAIDVGPDFNFLRVDRRAHQRSGEVGAAAAERGGNAFLVGGNEAAHHGDAIFSIGGDARGCSRVSLGDQRRCVRVARIGHDHVAGIEMHARNALAFECQRHDAARKPLAIARHRVERARSKFSNRAKALHDFPEVAKMVAQDRFEFLAMRFRHERQRFPAVEIFDWRAIARSLRLACPGPRRRPWPAERSSSCPWRKQPPPDASASRERTMSATRRMADGGFEGTASEFHYDHWVMSPFVRFIS